uniref:Uncharacterized protein n=1 Tax=Ficus carica TaxID=3494 RepID=A0AA87ZHF5_FICCA|nr:hypothetical protein TIFTF001_041941 [Ficus carica]GMN33752.1 hypothetical protein TIFTF001_041945 [Ficus carica]
MKRLLFLARVFCIIFVGNLVSLIFLDLQTPPALLAASLGRCGTGVCKPRPSAPPPPATPIIPARKRTPPPSPPILHFNIHQGVCGPGTCQRPTPPSPSSSSPSHM